MRQTPYSQLIGYNLAHCYYEHARMMVGNL